MALTMYGTKPSNPSASVRLMLEYKGVEHRIVWLLPALHPQLVRLHGFRGNTVPAVRVNGRKVQNSRAIARLLEELQAEPRLFPADPQKRLEVEEAERWGEETLQDIPRAIYRWMAATSHSFRTEIAREIGLPFPSVVVAANIPAIKRVSQRAGGQEGARQALRDLPAAMDHVDSLIADGIIGGKEPNAADFQIVPSVRILAEMEDTAPFVTGRPADAWSRALLPDSPGHAPALLPREWIGEAEPAK
jgi:glutathione S-transferase